VEKERCFKLRQYVPALPPILMAVFAGGIFNFPAGLVSGDRVHGSVFFSREIRLEIRSSELPAFPADVAHNWRTINNTTDDPIPTQEGGPSQELWV